MPTSTVENYVKQLYIEQQRGQDKLVSMGKLAAAMGVVPGTATTMMKALSDSGLVAYEPRGGVRLTRGGEKLALHILRRHRLIELFLVQALGMDWSEVHPEAEELEHVVSDKVLDRIDAFLGHPSTDPHGDPIPSAQGQLVIRRHASLADCALNETVKVARVVDQDPAFLQFVDKCGLMPGTPLVVESRNVQADAVTVRPSGAKSFTLGSTAAGKILVEED
jgi:DtxR family Mn-dependent transcriptional regulator